MNRAHRLSLGFAPALLAGLLACGGGGGGGGGTTTTPPPKTVADRLDYTNPSSGSFTLVKDTTLSTSSHLVLNLLGPAGSSATGVGFILSADQTRVTWSKPVGSDAVLARSGLFDLGTTTPQLVVGKSTGDQLQVAFYQKGTTKPPVTFTASSVLASVALDLKSGIPVGTVISISAVSGKAVLSQGSAAPQPIAIATGTLVAN
jgi:hypothetical protein